MNELKIFAYEDEMVRTVKKDGELWFVAKDVAEILGYRSAPDMTRSLDEDEMVSTQIVRRNGEHGNPNVTIISESGLYHAIFQSRKEEARAFRKWVTSEVLPQIRKTGSYGTQKSETEILGEQLLAVLDKTAEMFDKGMLEKGEVSSIVALLVNDKGRRRFKKKNDDNEFVLSKERLDEVAAFCDKFCDISGKSLDSVKLTDLYGVYKRVANERVMKRFLFKNAISELYDTVQFSAQTPRGENVLCVRGMSLKQNYWELI